MKVITDEALVAEIMIDIIERKIPINLAISWAVERNEITDQFRVSKIGKKVTNEQDEVCCSLIPDGEI